MPDWPPLSGVFCADRSMLRPSFRIPHSAFRIPKARQLPYHWQNISPTSARAKQ
jgi:hypothetical protein